MCPSYADYCTREIRVVLRVVRNEMGVVSYTGERVGMRPN
jgi:hypothetical protein